MRIFAVLLALLALSAVGVRAEEVETPASVQDELAALRARQIGLVRELLQTRLDSKIAWGATWARELKLTELEPDLVDLIHDAGQGTGEWSEQTLFAILDALVHFEAHVEATLLLPFVAEDGPLRRYADAAVILAVRSGNPHTQLAMFDVLDANDGSSGLAWLALGNALNDPLHGPAGFVARLIARLELTLRITVVDHDLLRGRGSSRDLSVTSGDGRRSLLDGYPTVWRHELREFRRPGDVLLADGPRPVFHRRREVTRGFGSTRRSQDRTTDRLAWIATRMRSKPEDLPLRQRSYGSIRWSDEGAFHSDVAAERARVAKAFAALVAQQAARGAISEAEAGTLRPHIRIHILDDREDKAVPLPSVTDDD